MEIENSVEYESPKFEFEKMMLTEKVAAVCWGYAYAWYDADQDGSIDGAEKVELSSLGLKDNGCQGNAAREALIKYFGDQFGIVLTEEQVATSTDSQVVIGSNS